MELYKERVEEFKSECWLFNLPFSHVGRVYPNFWDFLYEIVSQRPHEQRPVQNGMILSKGIDWTSSSIGFTKEDYYLDDSADGKKVFRLSIRDDTKDRTVIFNTELCQTELLLLVEDERRNTIIITRSNTETRVFYHGTISVLENRDWTIYKSKKTTQNELCSIIKPIPPQLKKLFDFAYYDLALDKIGTTLVYCMDDEIDLSKMKAKNPTGTIDISNDVGMALLKRYAINHDGAIIVNSNSIIVKISAKLAPKEESIRKVVDKYHFDGMRHTSSAAYSLEHSNTIIITTSDDGGATVFKDGKKVFSMLQESGLLGKQLTSYDKSIGRMNFVNLKDEPSIIKRKDSIKTIPTDKRGRFDFSSHLEAFRKMAEEYGDYSEVECTTAKCPNCNQLYRVGYVRVAGWNDHEELRCNNCGTIYYSKSCLELVGEPVYDKQR